MPPLVNVAPEKQTGEEANSSSSSKEKRSFTKAKK
jgi:hypothetical protein